MPQNKGTETSSQTSPGSEEAKLKLIAGALYDKLIYQIGESMLVADLSSQSNVTALLEEMPSVVQMAYKTRAGKTLGVAIDGVFEIIRVLNHIGDGARLEDVLKLMKTQPEQEQVIHHLHFGGTPCGLSAKYGVPRDWPPGHIFEHPCGWIHVTCAECRACATCCTPPC